jgi:hypothetical protein
LRNYSPDHPRRFDLRQPRKIKAAAVLLSLIKTVSATEGGVVLYRPVGKQELDLIHLSAKEIYADCRATDFLSGHS